MTATCLAALFVYHNQRIYSFITHTASREFFLTADEEELRDWLRRRDASLGKYTLATASHELNYLAAYWNHADLLLPEGFPLHSVESNAEIKSGWPVSWPSYAHRPAGSISIYTAQLGTNGAGVPLHSSPHGTGICTICSTDS